MEVRRIRLGLCLLQGRFPGKWYGRSGAMQRLGDIGRLGKDGGEAVGAMGEGDRSLRKMVALDRTASCFWAARTDLRLAGGGGC